jgi:hypothetical protein
LLWTIKGFADLRMPDFENRLLKEEIKYLKEKIDQLMEVIEKKG